MHIDMIFISQTKTRKENLMKADYSSSSMELMV